MSQAISRCIGTEGGRDGTRERKTDKFTQLTVFYRREGGREGGRDRKTDKSLKQQASLFFT